MSCVVHSLAQQCREATSNAAMTKPGFLYVLVHPRKPNLYKVGVTINAPEKRLSQHNSQLTKYAGKIVQETGELWQLKTSINVVDPHWAEKCFWGATGLTEIPFRSGIEIEVMAWETVQRGLDAAMSAGRRPPPAVPEWVEAYDFWMHKRLEGRGIYLLGHVRSKYGRSDFACSNGHKWRAKPITVAEGCGCPECGMGAQNSEIIHRATGAGFIFLLVHPARPGFIKVVLHLGDRDCLKKDALGEWELHRYRSIEGGDLAERVIWELLGKPLPHDREPIEMELSAAEQAMRQLHYRLQEALASSNRERMGGARQG